MFTLTTEDVDELRNKPFDEVLVKLQNEYGINVAELLERVDRLGNDDISNTDITSGNEHSLEENTETILE